MTASSSVRAYIEGELKTLAPKPWRIIPEQRVPDQITGITVILKHTRIERLREAPIGNLTNTVIATIATPHADIGRAEDELDDAVVELLTAIDGHARLGWTVAEKVSIDEKYLGWDITLTALTERK